MDRVRVLGLVIAALLGAGGPAGALSVEKLLGHGRLVGWAPREPAARPSARALNTDAELLLALGFRAAATRATSRASVPACRFFKRRGFATVLVGIADPGDAAEIRRAIRLRRCADAYVVGDEGLGTGRYGRDDLERVVGRLRAATGRPVAVRETLQALHDDPRLVRLGDWLLPTIQPWRAGKGEGQDACGWTIFAYRELAAQAPAGVPTVPETALPTAGALGTSEHYQRAFFLCLESRQVPFGYATAWDDPTSADVVRAHGGLVRADGAPKLWAAQQLHPTLAVERAGPMLRGRIGNAPRGLWQIVAYVQGTRWDALPAVVPDRRGAWTLAAPADRPVAVYVATRFWRPPPSLDRRPRPDRLQILAERELPAM
jgi:hypothetical protein